MADEKKIIIDEDWKSQVAAEKEAAARQTHGEAASGPAAPPGPDASGSSAPPHEAEGIPASFELLVTTFVTEAMVALGQLPHPATNKLQFDPVHARFAIDMLEVIAEKTKGNLEPIEDRGLQDVLHQLRMAFIVVKNQHSDDHRSQTDASPIVSTWTLIT